MYMGRSTYIPEIGSGMYVYGGNVHTYDEKRMYAGRQWIHTYKETGMYVCGDYLHTYM